MMANVKTALWMLGCFVAGVLLARLVVQMVGPP